MLVVVALATTACEPTPWSSGVDPGRAVGRLPVTITNRDRTLTFNRAPSRAVLGFNSLAEVFVGLGLADRAVGRTAYGQLAEAPVPPEQAAGMQSIPVVSDALSPPKREKLLRQLHPGVFE